MGVEVSSAEVANAVVSKPVEGSVTDRATPSLSMLKSEAGKAELDKAQVTEITRWIAEKRKRIEQDIKEFDEIYSAMQVQFQKRGRSYNLFWEGVDLVWKDLPGTTAWKTAYGAAGDREKALKSFAMKIAELGQKLVTLDRQTHYREGDFRNRRVKKGLRPFFPTKLLQTSHTMETFEFNQDFLQRAKDISVADMLDSPFCQAWMMSCISNCVVNYDKFPECGDQDDFLHYKLNRVLNCVPREEKMELFKQCHQMIADRKAYMQQKQQQQELSA